jgi:hypothetical protein
MSDDPTKIYRNKILNPTGSNNPQTQKPSERDQWIQAGNQIGADAFKGAQNIKANIPHTGPNRNNNAS